MAKRRWQNEKRSGLELIRAWVAQQGSQAEAARLLDLSRQRLWAFLNIKDRGLDDAARRRVAREVGIPLGAVIFKHEPLCDIVEDAA